MEWRDEQKPDEDASTPPRVKPRRIDAAHTLMPAADTPAGGIPTPVSAFVGAGEVATEADQASVIHGDSSAESSSLDSGVSGNDIVEAHSLSPSAVHHPPADDLSLETEQLATALADQLRELEEREAQLAARAADLEREWKACQAWYQQQLAELAPREAELARRQTELEVFERREEEQAERLRDCEAQEMALDRREADLNEREATMVAQDHELRHRRQEVERHAAALSRSQQLWEQSKTRDEQALDRQHRQMQTSLEEQLTARLEKLEADQALLAEHARGIEVERESLRRDREEWQRQRQQDADHWTEQQRRAQDELDRRVTAVSARESALDTQQAALEQLRGEMMIAHRQALEMRLIGEQLWAQVKGLLTPAEIAQSLAQLRLKMAAQYELEEKSLAERKEELLALADKLAQQHVALKAQRMEFLAWRKAQQEEIAHQAEHLCRRIQELSEEQKRLRETEQAWHDERRQLQEQLRESSSRRAA